MKNLREILSKMAEINAGEMTDEKREQYAALEREYKMAKMENDAELQEQQAREAQPKKSSSQAFREFLQGARKNGGNTEIVLRGATAGINLNYITADTEKNNIAAGGAIPTTINQLLPLLQNSLVYDKLGINIATGVKGNLVWPVLAAGCTATVGGEEVSVSDSKIEFSKVNAQPKTVAVATRISYEALDNAAFDVQAVATQNLTEATAQVLNGAVTAITSGNFDSPFAHSDVQSVTFKTGETVPTFAELLSMKAKVASANIKMKAPAFVMNNTMYAALQATPKAEGQCGFIVGDDGKIAGYPVLVTEAATKILFGDFSYCAINQHGESRLIVDPYSAASTGELKLTLRADWSVTTLRGKAFCKGSL